MEIASTSSIRFSTRELIYFVTFLSVMLAMSVWAGSSMGLVLVHGVVLSVAIFLAGSWLYRWIIAGAMVVPLLLLALLAQFTYGDDIRTWTKIGPDILIAVCFGSACGAVLGLDRMRKEFLRMLPLGLAMVELLWLLLPRVD